MMLRRGAALLTALSLALMPVALAAVLEVGSRGDDVAAVQRKLIAWGYLSGSADGRYGAKTRDAVLAFQRRNGLSADGRVGPATGGVLGVTLSGGCVAGACWSEAASLEAPEKKDDRDMAWKELVKLWTWCGQQGACKRCLLWRV